MGLIVLAIQMSLKGRQQSLYYTVGLALTPHHAVLAEDPLEEKR